MMRRRWDPRHGVLALLAIVALFICASPARAEASQRIYTIRVYDTIQPITQEYIHNGLEEAAANGATAVVLQLGTPGGLLDPAQQIVDDIEHSSVPVFVFVDAEAREVSSSGLLLLESADVAAMAPDSILRIQHRWRGLGKDPDPAQRQNMRAENGALLREIATRHRRRGVAIDAALTTTGPISAAEALHMGLIDFIANDMDDLLHAIDGHPITHAGSALVLNLPDPAIVRFLPTFRERLLRPLMNPDLAILLLAVGALLIYLEFNTPGTVIFGLTGTFLFLLAVFALRMLPLSNLSVLLLVIALVLIVIEAHFSSYGIFALMGIGLLVVALATLVPGPIPEMRVGFGTALGTGIGFGGVTAGLVILGIQARRAKVKIGAEAMIGWLAIAQNDINPEGQVLVRGELWQARLSDAQKPIFTGERAKISGMDGLTLIIVSLNLEENGRRWRAEVS